MSKSEEGFYSRLRELSNIKKVVTEDIVTRTLVNSERSNDGIAYGIVKENHEYIIKKSLTEGDNLHAADFTYIGGVQNKSEYNYKSLGEAEKQRNLHIKSLNEAFDLGGVYTKKNKAESPSLETGGDVNTFLHDVIKAGKSNIRENHETKFKAGLKENVEASKSNTGLMPEVALNAVQKALGKVNEEAGEGVPFTEADGGSGDIVTADSEVKDGDIVSDKKGKEESQAPITDKNAKSKADAATATGTKDFNKKDGDSKSLAVNQADKKLTEAEDLVTADSELDANASVANSNQTKESPQAPINDTNAKAEAEKNNATGGSSEAISNNVEESPESDPFDDKENAGDETGDIVTGEKNITESAELESDPFEENAKGEGDIATKDSDQADGDRVDNVKTSEKTESDYGAEKQPEKGQKEEKGEELKDTAKEVVIGEGKDLITADSEINTKESPVNKVTAPNTDAESQITKDSDMNPDDSVANKTETNLPNPVFEGEDLITADSEIDAASSPANKTQTNLPNPVAEGEEEVDIDAIAEGIDDLVNDLDVATEKDKVEEPAPEVPAEPEMDLGGGDEIAPEPEMDLGGGDEIAPEPEMPDLGTEAGDDEGIPDLEPEAGEEAPEGEGGDPEKEIEKNIGKANQLASSPDLELDPNKTQELINSVLGSFESHIAQLAPEDKETTAKKITNASAGSEGGEEPAPDMNGDGLDGEATDAIDAEIAGLDDAPVEEDAPMQVNGEDFVEPEGEGECEGCDTFEGYVKSRGYDSMEECSVSEAASLVSGFVTKGGQDYEAVAPFINDEVKGELQEYGHVDYLEQVQPFCDKLGEDQKMSFGTFEPMATDVFGEDEFEGGEEAPVDAPADIDVPAEVDSEMGAEEVPAELDAEIGAEVPVDVEPEVDVEVPEAPVDAVEEPMGFATDTDVMGGGVVKPDGAAIKSVEVDVNAGKVNVNMAEGEVKLRNYVQAKLEELTGKRKPAINESEKSDTIKKLDKLIVEQFNLYSEEVKKTI